MQLEDVLCVSQEKTDTSAQENKGNQSLERLPFLFLAPEEVKLFSASGCLTDSEGRQHRSFGDPEPS